VRFERDRGEGFARIFPETFSFRADRHDPAELYLQLDDLARKPQLLSPRANARDAQLLISRLVVGLPRHLESLLERLEGEARLQEEAMTRVYEDVVILAHTLSRLISESDVEERPGIRMASYHLRRLAFRCMFALVERRVTPSYRDAYAMGKVDPVDPADDLSEAGFFYTMESGQQDAVNRSLIRLAERSFYRWLEDVCLEEDNQAFEVEGSPFESRETEVLRAIARKADTQVLRAEDLSPFIRRPGNRDCLRVLHKLSSWFLRQYDIHHAAAMIRLTEDVARGGVEGGRILSRHRTRNYLLAILALVAPFLGATFAYESSPRFFDLLCAGQLVVVYAIVLWFLLYRFCLKRDLTFFHSSVPRIAAGIIVGYLPILFIDEVWALANRPWAALAAVSLLLGFTTLLYLYIEVQRRLRDADLAFARAGRIFLLGVLQSFGTGLVIMGLTGGFMASRNWSGVESLLSIEVLRETLPPLAGELPRIVGFEPFYTFPGAICLMTFLSFFIGTFLQLLWEDIPITEPL
jgi:hypothetical protein